MPSITRLLTEPGFRPAWRWLLVLLLLVTSTFAFAPRAPSLGFEGADKVNHVLAFGALATVAALGLDAAWRRLLSVACCLLLYGAFVEVVQSQLPTRQADWADLLADGVGTMGGLALCHLLRWVFAAPQK